MRNISLFFFILILFTACQKQQYDDGRNNFVYIADVVPDAILEIRYYGTYNFIGTRIDGYLAPTALLTCEAADSLKAVSDDVIAQGYRLKIYDAYRPQRAVDHFMRWRDNPDDTIMKRYFYPMYDKPYLFENDYICPKSGHTRGSTVDLTLFDMVTEKELDMGGTFDWFGGQSHPDYCCHITATAFGESYEYIPDTAGLTEQQVHNRLILRQAMMRHGFKPLDSEWWHFTLRDEPFPDTYFDFPIE
ncbi:MAG: M15 family metallopeptidase [Paludibacteraceae bacterium]|nr:M15 family metallopeptidase [Paludibacteraceae bacterium]